jgi:hypothetical protein
MKPTRRGRSRRSLFGCILTSHRQRSSVALSGLGLYYAHYQGRRAPALAPYSCSGRSAAVRSPKVFAQKEEVEHLFLQRMHIDSEIRTLPSIEDIIALLD